LKLPVLTPPPLHGKPFQDGKDEKRNPLEIDYDTRSGDIAFIDR
jgi:hypothetical protein